MIKGCSKKVIVIKNTGSDLFEEAYFIINPKESERKHGDFLLEANRIIASKTLPCTYSAPKNRILPYVLGFIMGAAAAFLMSCILF